MVVRASMLPSGRVYALALANQMRRSLAEVENYFVLALHAGWTVL